MNLEDFIQLIKSLRARDLSYKDIEMLLKFQFSADTLRQFTKNRSKIKLSANMEKRINLFQYEHEEDKIKKLLGAKATWRNFNGFNRSINNQFKLFG